MVCFVAVAGGHDEGTWNGPREGLHPGKEREGAETGRDKKPDASLGKRGPWGAPPADERQGPSSSSLAYQLPSPLIRFSQEVAQRSTWSY